MGNYSQTFFDSYNAAYGRAYDSYIQETGTNFQGEADDNENMLDSFLKAEYAKWLCTPLEALSGETPQKFLESIDSLDALVEMFNYGVIACDDGLPESYIEKLRSYGEKAVDALLDTAALNGAEDDSDEMLAPLMAVKLLGQWRVSRAAEPLLKLLSSEDRGDGLLHEAIKDTLVCIGEPSLEAIFSALDSGTCSQETMEYLLMALADIGKKKRTDSIYIHLKKAFLEMPQKLIAASCLGDYGDGRAVTALRGYLEKRGQQTDKETFYEIISSIKRLGGRTDDLKLD
ncbi:MAG: hypothetical protein ABFD25_08670 [Clostridiaceae bacterium]